MGLLDEIASTNDAQIAAIDVELEALKAHYLADRAELRAARSILVGRRKRVGRELARGQAALPFEPASAVVTEHLARVEREAEGEDEIPRDLPSDNPMGGRGQWGMPEAENPEPIAPARRRRGVAGG